MDYIAEPIKKLINNLSRLPSVGPKSAQRLAYHIIDMDEKSVRDLAESIFYAKKHIRKCSVCGNLTVDDVCGVCKDPRRDTTIICVVSSPRDVLAIEKTHEYSGLYHVLGGSISPMDGIGPDDINIKGLVSRLKDNAIKEVILATNTDVEGEATAVYISRMLTQIGVNSSRIAHGVPVGGNIEYADEVTIIKAFENRR